MPTAKKDVDPASTELARVTALLGGRRALGRRVESRLDAHRLLLDGLPAEALRHLIENVELLSHAAALQRALGVSTRTLQRRTDLHRHPLSVEHSSRAWKFAEILAQASAVFGSQDAAERWLETPALGLEQNCPIDLLSSPAGVEIVETFLQRLEYGVYA